MTIPIESLADLIKMVRNAYQMEQNHTATASIARQYQHQKEQLFDNFVLELMETDLDAGSIIALVYTGRIAFKIYPEQGLGQYLGKLLDKIQYQEQGQSPPMSLLRLMFELSMLPNAEQLSAILIQKSKQPPLAALADLLK